VGAFRERGGRRHHRRCRLGDAITRCSGVVMAVPRGWGEHVGAAHGLHLGPGWGLGHARFGPGRRKADPSSRELDMLQHPPR